MLRFAVRRVLLLVPVLLGLSFLVFLFVRALPGGPENALLGERGNPERAAAVREAYGLDRPVLVQYGKYMERVAELDFGTSIKTNRPVTEEIKRTFPATVELALSALLIATSVGIPLGYVAGRRPGSAIDITSTVGSLLGVAIPVFVLGYLLKYVFAVKLGWLPDSGRILLRGDIPSAAAIPSGCRFHTRCPWRQETRCDDEVPVLRHVAAGQVACHWAEQVADGTLRPVSSLQA